MSAFGSSAITKTTKKLAPKAPPRRRPTAQLPTLNLSQETTQPTVEPASLPATAQPSSSKDNEPAQTPRNDIATVQQPAIASHSRPETAVAPPAPAPAPAPAAAAQSAPQALPVVAEALPPVPELSDSSRNVEVTRTSAEVTTKSREDPRNAEASRTPAEVTTNKREDTHNVEVTRTPAEVTNNSREAPHTVEAIRAPAEVTKSRPEDPHSSTGAATSAKTAPIPVQSTIRVDPDPPIERPTKRVRISSAEPVLALLQAISPEANAIPATDTTQAPAISIPSSGSSQAPGTVNAVVNDPGATNNVQELPPDSDRVANVSRVIPAKKKRTLPWGTTSNDAAREPSAKVKGKRKAPQKVTEAGDTGDGTTVAGTDASKKPRKVRKDKGQPRKKSTGDGTSVAEVGDAPPKKRRKSKATSSATAAAEGADAGEGEAAEGGTKKVRKRRKRAATPEEMENEQIAPETMRMSDLCTDTRRGKKSRLEVAMRQIDWTEVVRRRKEAERQARPDQNGESSVNERLERAARLREAADIPVPQLRLVNGQMVVDQASLVVDRHAEATRTENVLEEVEEDDLTTRINSHSWLGSVPKDPAERGIPSKSQPWTELETDSFYDALRMFGTDFYIISKMFPGKTRRHIKLKFVREERTDPERIKAALIRDNVPMDLETFRAATGQALDAFKDPKELEKELELENEKHREDIERQKELQVEAARLRRAAELETATGESSKENEVQQETGGKKATAKGRRKKPIGGEVAEVLGADG